MADILRYEDFAPHVGKSFRFEGWHGTLRLASAEQGRERGNPAVTRDPFILIFHGPRGDVLPQGLYTATVEDGARFDFYVMPIHTVAPDRQEYQAVFS